MALDPTKHPDWQIAQDAEKSMKTVETLAAELGLEKDELLPYGHYMGKIEQQAVLRRLADRPNGKYVDVTAITPTPLGEGKSTTTIGLVQGLSKRGVKTTAAIRQPSGGPTMGMKGSAAGGGLAQCIPLTPYSLNFTGDIHAITSAHNLAMVALTSRMQHERNHDDEKLEPLCRHAPPRRRPHPRGHGLGHGLLLSGPAQRHHRHRRRRPPQRRFHDAFALRHHGRLGDHVHHVPGPRPARPAQASVARGAGF